MVAVAVVEVAAAVARARARAARRVRPVGAAMVAPQIASGRLVPGGSATLQLTLTNIGSSDYTKYPGAILSTTTPGISFATNQATVALLAAAQSRALTWSVAVAPSVPVATSAAFAAHVIGGGAIDCPDASSVQFSFAVESP
jgi:hypothetical protein